MRAKKPIVIVDAYYDGEGQALCPAATGFTHHISPWGDIEPCPIIQFAKESIHDERPLKRDLPDSRPSSATSARRPPSTPAAASCSNGPTCSKQLVAKPRRARHHGPPRRPRRARRDGAPPLAIQPRPGNPRKILAYRLAKYFFFNDYGTYGKHFDAKKWIDSREKPLEQSQVQQPAKELLQITT